MLKKTTIMFVIILIFTAFFGVNVHALEKDESDEIDEFIAQSGAQELYDDLPEESQIFLQENGITDISVENLSHISFFDFIKSIVNFAKKTATMPIVIFAKCVGIILLCAMLNSMKAGLDSTYEQMFFAVSVLCLCETLILPMVSIVKQVANVIKNASTFMMSFVPIYAGTITASGKPISALSYQSSLIVVAQVVSNIAATVLVPLLGIYLAFCLIGAVCDKINVIAIATSVQKVVTISLSFLLTIFVGILTINSNVSGACDNIGVRGAKFAISTFLPVVGGCVSEAFSTVQGYMGILKSSVGGFSIIGIVSIFLPSVISILAVLLSVKLAGAVSETLEATRISLLLRSCGQVLSLCFSIVIIFFILIIVSIGIMLKI